MNCKLLMNKELVIIEENRSVFSGILTIFWPEYDAFSFGFFFWKPLKSYLLEFHLKVTVQPVSSKIYKSPKEKHPDIYAQKQNGKIWMKCMENRNTEKRGNTERADIIEPNLEQWNVDDVHGEKGNIRVQTRQGGMISCHTQTRLVEGWMCVRGRNCLTSGHLCQSVSEY